MSIRCNPLVVCVSWVFAFLFFCCFCVGQYSILKFFKNFFVSIYRGFKCVFEISLCRAIAFCVVLCYYDITTNETHPPTKPNKPPKVETI